jgi:chlorobactene glucosyltransferase
MLALWAVVLLLLLAVTVLLYHGVTILFAYQMPRLEPAPPVRGRVEGISGLSIVIAARNEALDLPGTLDDLLAQDRTPAAIVVVDGGSTDGTGAVIDARAPRVQRIDEPPLPNGWVGKSWACWNGARATRGEWILFMDADVRTHPAAVRTALEWAEREGADLASIGTRIEMRSFWERVVLPFYIQMVLVHLRSPRVNRPGSTAAMANGQFLLVRRDVYESLGGHEAVRAAVLEDVALAQRFRAAGRTLRVAWAPDLASTRMYRRREEMFEGLLKTVHGVQYSTRVQVGRVVGMIALFLLPLGLLPFGWAVGSAALIAMGAFLWIALIGKHIAFDRAVGAPAAYGVLYPLSVAYYLVVLATSIARGSSGRPVYWKGRAYGIRPSR